MTKASRLKLMIIEDNLDERHILESFFSKENDIELCGVFSNGLDAIANTESLIPDIILTDFIMPGIDGFGVIESIKAKKHLTNTKIIMCSGVGDSKVVSAAFSAGVDYYIMKPVSLSYLKRCIKNFSKSLTEEKSDYITNNSSSCISKQDNTRNVIKDLGIPVNMSGYSYIIDAIGMMLKSERSILLKEIYGVLAERNSTSPYCIEMSIRNAVKKAYKYKNALFVNMFKAFCPCNSVFLRTVSEFVS